MNDELKISFDTLDINTKRNQISSELLLINEIIKNIENNYNIENSTKIKNYNPLRDKNLTEGEILTFFYEDIYNIEKELITIVNLINNK